MAVYPGNAGNILIINDEAHHCHRPSADEDEDEKEKATIWVSGIDRIHGSRGVLRAYDLSATPFKPTGKINQGEQLFTWIVSDFGLNDAIESGLVKTPKVAVRDDSNLGPDLKSKLFHIYSEVREDLNRRAEPHEGLPDLVRNAVNILGGDWLKEKESWANQEQPRETPPVMIMICNRTETAARLEYSMVNSYFAVDELGEKDALIRIDQDALDKIESDEAERINADKSGKKLVESQREKFNFHGLVMLDKLIGWAPHEIVVEKRIKKEASHSMNGPIDLDPYISSGAMLEEEIHGKEQEGLFYKYCNQKIGNSAIHAGEAACLALAISKGYGLISDELVIRNEFKSRCPGKTCVIEVRNNNGTIFPYRNRSFVSANLNNSWDIVDISQKLSYIDQSEANALKKSLYYV